MNKKGQSELMGLIFIIVIVSVAMLFYLSYSVDSKLDKSKDNKVRKFEHSEISVSFVNVLLDTSSCSVSVEDLIVDCATNRHISCPGGNSCITLNETITSIINDTLYVWDVPYGFIVDFGSWNYTYSTYNCTPQDVTVAPGRFFVPLFPGHVMLELGFCG
jgi:hypothetical protein